MSLKLVFMFAWVHVRTMVSIAVTQYACVCTRACLWVRAAPQYSYDYVQIAQYYNKTSSQAMWLQLDDYNDDKDGSGDDDSVVVMLVDVVVSVPSQSAFLSKCPLWGIYIIHVPSTARAAPARVVI